MESINIKQIKTMTMEKLWHRADTVKTELPSLMQLSAIAPSLSVYFISLVAVFCGRFLQKSNFKKD